MRMSARCVGPFISITAAVLVPNCRTDLAPLAQSAERIQGKENPEAILLVRCPPGTAVVQVNADRSIWINWQRLAAIGIGWRTMLISLGRESDKLTGPSLVEACSAKGSEHSSRRRPTKDR